MAQLTKTYGSVPLAAEERSAVRAMLSWPRILSLISSTLTDWGSALTGNASGPSQIFMSAVHSCILDAVVKARDGLSFFTETVQTSVDFFKNFTCAFFCAVHG